MLATRSKQIQAGSATILHSWSSLVTRTPLLAIHSHFNSTISSLVDCRRQSLSASSSSRTLPAIAPSIRTTLVGNIHVPFHELGPCMATGRSARNRFEMVQDSPSNSALVLLYYRLPGPRVIHSELWEVCHPADLYHVVMYCRSADGEVKNR